MGRKIGVFGGSFDPIHEAHVQAGEAARDQLGLDVVMFVVANQPWQKVDTRAVTDARLRLQMVELALAGHEKLEASPMEIDRGGVSYSIDTVREILAGEPDAEIWLLVGSDIVSKLSTWKDHLEIAKLVALGVFARPGYEFSKKGDWKAEAVEMEPSTLSSSAIRTAIADAKEPEGLAPAVANFIRELEIYQENSA